eukprot:TRINITY_DN1507_c0_g1_i1.p1 TRINITY_DN1507_c0_g1~~TRINITY_DN1507_c0_g1_i1.p1  ORF type:complete len:487 (+),score=46.88 TRINITY_DN1507_c0_g1_i1:106-1566(+)
MAALVDQSTSEGSESDDAYSSDLESAEDVRAEMLLPECDGGENVPDLRKYSTKHRLEEVRTGTAKELEKEKKAKMTPRLEALDGPRWLASIMIVGSHFYGFAWGGAWTQFFFMLSGFVLSYVEMARAPSKSVTMTKAQYVRKRLITIYPTYILTIVFVMIQQQNFFFDWITLPLHIFLIESWFPIVYPLQNPPFPMPLCSVFCAPSAWRWATTSWFLSVLVVYWLILRPLSRFMRRQSLRVALLILVGCFGWSVMNFPAAYLKEMYGVTWPPTRWQWTITALWQFGPLGYLHVFVAGVAAARILILTSMCDAATGEPPHENTERLALDGERAPLPFRYGCCIGYVVYIGLVFGFPQFSSSETYSYWFFHNGGLIPVMLLILTGGALGVDPLATYVFQSKPFLVLGRISYAQYLMQHTVHHMVEMNLPGAQLETTRYWVYPFALTLFSYCVERFFTSTYTEWHRWRQEKGHEGWDDKFFGLLDRIFG